MSLPPQTSADRTGRAGHGASGWAGATLFYGPSCARPDLTLAAQFLLDDLRAEGMRPAGLRVNAHTLRLRTDGAELALALSTGPLAGVAMQGFCRPLETGTGRSAAMDENGTGPIAAERLLTDLDTIRLGRALRHHQAALGVVLRRRGIGGPIDLAGSGLDARLRAVLLTLVEAAPPVLVLWQRTGMILTCREFLRSPVEVLQRPGQPAALPGQKTAAASAAVSEGPAQRHVPAHSTARPAIRATLAATPGGTLSAPNSRSERAARRSAGRLFGKFRASDGRRPRPALPQLQTGTAELSLAMRQDFALPHAPARKSGRRRIDCLLLGLWFALILPDWTALKTMLTL